MFLLTLQRCIAEKLNEMLVFCMNAHDFGHAEANEMLRLFWRVLLHTVFLSFGDKKTMDYWKIVGKQCECSGINGRNTIKSNEFQSATISIPCEGQDCCCTSKKCWGRGHIGEIGRKKER